jgi:hypothetical protein
MEVTGRLSTPAALPPFQSKTSVGYWIASLMRSEANGQPHAPADLTQECESLEHFEQEAGGDDKIIPSGNRNVTDEPSDSASDLSLYT